MRIVIGKTVIRTAKSLRKILELAMSEKRSDTDLFRMFLIVYQCRVFGLCFYPSSRNWISYEEFLKKYESTVEKND